MSRSWEVSRRACLRGTGTAIGLPVLEAMLPGVRRARAASTPASCKRVVFFVFNNGTSDTSLMTTGSGGTDTTEGRPGAFWPKTLGTDFEITKILEPLRDLKSEILVIRDLSNMIAEGPNRDGGHPQAANAILSGVYPTNAETPDVVAAITADQIAANDLKKHTPAVPSLFLSHPFHHDYNQQLVSWADRTTALFPIQQPSEAFKTIFGDKTVDETTRRKRIFYKTRTLDRAKADVRRLRGKLGSGDLQTLDKYLARIDDLETQVMAQGNLNKCATPAFTPMDSTYDAFASETPNYLTVFNPNLPKHMAQMSELVTLAFQCDITRVVTIQLQNHDLRFDWLGSEFADYHKAAWHGDATHGGDRANPDREKGLDLYTAGSAGQVAIFADLVRKMRNTPEGADGNGMLLDNSILVCCSDMCYGNGHNLRHVPVIVAGRGGGAVKPGRFIAAPPREQPIANLWVSMLNAVGIDVDTVGDSTGAQALT